MSIDHYLPIYGSIYLSIYLSRARVATTSTVSTVPTVSTVLSINRPIDLWIYLSICLIVLYTYISNLANLSNLSSYLSISSTWQASSLFYLSLGTYPFIYLSTYLPYLQSIYFLPTLPTYLPTYLPTLPTLPTYLTYLPYLPTYLSIHPSFNLFPSLLLPSTSRAGLNTRAPGIKPAC